MMETMNEEVQSTESSAPLAGAKSGRLELRHGVSRFTLKALGPDQPSTYREDGGGLLYRARFRGRVPEVEVHDGAIEVSYVRRGLFDWRAFDWRSHQADFELAASIPWDIEVRGGTSDLRGDLATLPVRSVSVRGGMSDTRLTLGAPEGPVPIEITGGVSELKIVRPANVGVRLNIRGGASDVTLDRQLFGAVGGKLLLTSTGFDERAPFYDVEIRGGASSISISGRD